MNENISLKLTDYRIFLAWEKEAILGEAPLGNSDGQTRMTEDRSSFSSVLQTI